MKMVTVILSIFLFLSSLLAVHFFLSCQSKDEIISLLVEQSGLKTSMIEKERKLSNLISVETLSCMKTLEITARRLGLQGKEALAMSAWKFGIGGPP